MENSKKKKKVEPLGATEFAATLNGDDPVAILQALKRFTKTVRRERRLALSSDEIDNLTDGDDSDSTMGESDNDEKKHDLQPPPMKKLKKTEVWKEDTNDYHVPFVGTAVARGDIAQVVKGQWPTGLLQTYLSKSPLAIELTGDDWIPSSTSSIHKSLLRRKQTKLSRAIYKTYLKALVELVTAAIPLDTLRDDVSISGSDSGIKMDRDEDGQQHFPFLSILLKKRLVGMFQLLGEETDKGRGKPGIYGGCGTFVPLIMKFLQNVSQTSITNARLVCRYLDEELPDGVFKTILRPPPPALQPKRNEDDAENAKEDPETRLKKPARIEAIILATILLRCGDAAVSAYICTAGSRERKIKPGIVYIAFREGLAKHSQTNGVGDVGDVDDYFDAVADMLECSRKLLQKPNLSKIVGSKLLLELFARDPLYHITDLSLCAPSLSTERSFQQVLDGTDEPDQGDSNALSYAGTEARRLLFLLLANEMKSPLLGNLTSKGQAHLLVNVMLRVLQAKEAGLEERRFLIHCVNTSPVLLPELFRVISIPDSKRSFEFMSVIRFAAMLMSNGPPPVACLEQPIEALLEANTSDVLATLWPLKLQRQSVGKAMQSGHSFVVLECIKCIHISLKRYHSIAKVMSNNAKSALLIDTLASAFSLFLPDVQLILAARVNYDPLSNAKGANLVCHALHLLLEDYSMILPNLIVKSSFDWMKLIPEPKRLLSVSFLVQRRIISCLHSILKCCAIRMYNHHNAGDSVAAILEIMLSTKDQTIYTQCRDMAQMIISPIIEARSTNKESSEYIKLELSWWLDAVTPQTLSALCNLISLGAEDSLAVLGRSGKALARSVETSQLNWSILMIAAFSEDRADIAFRTMVIQVATRVLLFHRNPVPFATFLLSVRKELENSDSLNMLPGHLLLDYAESILDFENVKSTTRLKRLQQLVKKVFSDSSNFCKVLELFSSDINSSHLASPQGNLEIARFSIHLHQISEELYQLRKVCQEVLRRVTPKLLLLSKNRIHAIILHTIQDVQMMNGLTSFSSTDAIILSYPRSNEPAFRSIRSRLPLKKSVGYSLGSHDSRLHLLRLSLLGRSCSAEEIVQVQLGLLRERPSEVSAAIVAEVVLSILSCYNPTIDSSDHKYPFIVLRDLFDLWWSLSTEEFSGYYPRHLKSRLIVYFGKLVASILCARTLESTYLLTQFSKKGEDAVILRCLQLNHPSIDDDERLANAAVLQSLLQSDPLRFGPSFLTKFSDEEFLHSETWRNGLLDQAAKILIAHPAIDSIEGASLSSFWSAILSRTISSLNAIQYNCVEGHEQSILVLANQVLSSNKFDIPMDRISNAAEEVLLATIESQDVLESSTLRHICSLGISLWKMKKAHSNDDKKSQRQLSSLLVCVLSESLLAFYKLGVRHHDVQAKVACVEILTALTSLVEEEHEFDQSIFTRAKKSLLQKVCRSALKYGIHDDLGTECHLATLSLRFVRILLGRYSRDPLLSGHFLLISPPNLFEMLTSHSKFMVMVSRKRNPEVDDSDRTELLHLMHCCVELAEDQIVLNSRLWRTLNAAFSAGLDELDLTIRRFYHLCSTITSDSFHVPFIDEVRWVGCDEEISREGRRWDWLIDALDTNRIRETVNRFPVYDSISLVSSASKERHLHAVDEDEDMALERGNSDDECDNSKGLRSPISPPYSLPTNTRFQSSFGVGTDERYSPAFILPLVLGALDSCVLDDCYDSGGFKDEVDNSASANPQEAKESRGSLVLMAKRLVEKNIPALCLASLASACEKVRILAISILAVMLKACNSNEARAMASWRERPQISLLLNSVQRAFVLEKATNPSGSNGSFPTLPTLVSTFLARASFSISKPDNPLYVALNRFFLKTDADSGAFQDMNRLPAFISLFCSANNEPLQSRKERIWALQLIRDGFLDAASYRLVSSCHAPELILSSLENIRLSTFSEEMKSTEYALLFDTVATLLNNGGRRAASHLIGKIGLLSWLQALCVARPLSQTFPLEFTRAALCALINSAADAILSHENLLKPSLVDEICGLIRPTLELGRISTTEKRHGNRTLLTASQALITFSLILRRLQDIEIAARPCIHPAGVTPDELMFVLKNTPQGTLHEMTRVLCELPCQLGQGLPGQKSAGELCIYLMEQVAKSNSMDSVGSSKEVLERISVIMDHFGADFGANTNKTLCSILLAARSHFQGSEEANRLWMKCLQHLKLTLPEDGVESHLALCVLRQA